MKRLCVFAHWDKDNLVEDYVIYYLKALKEVCDILIFVSDSNVLPSEVEKLSGISDYYIIGSHGEYDFGSYKRGFLFAKEHNIEFDELLFVNDSCYGPFYPLKPIFEKMKKKKCDFWGLTKNNYGIKKENGIGISAWAPHIQSYFLNFNKNVFESEVFVNFIKNIKKEDDKDTIIINYEIGLSKLLLTNGFTPSVYINRYGHTENCLSTKWKRLIKKYNFPLLKTKIVTRGIFVQGEVKDWRETIISVCNYPVIYIENHSSRYKKLEENLYKDFNLYRKIRYKILINSPMELRKIVILAEKYCFIFLNMIFFNKLKKF